MHRLLQIVAFEVLLIAPIHCVLGQRCSVLRLNVDGVIHPVTVGMVDKAISQAHQQNCDVLIIRLNTPGGFSEATRNVTEKLLASRVPVVTWVGPGGARAASAGFFILEASDVAAMAPGTNAGAAHPVLLVGTPDPTLAKKLENDAAASLRSLAERRGRNPSLAEKAVLESRSFTDKEAIGSSLIDLVAVDFNDLLRQLNGREVKRYDGSRTTLHVREANVLEYQPTLSQRVQTVTADPNIALGLLLLGGLLLYVEISTPGLILPGVAGAILVLVGLSAFSVLPVTWTGTLLMVLAVLLFILEAKVASHGVLGLGGLVAMVLGATLLIDSPLPALRIHPSAAFGLTVPFGLILLFLVTLVIRARRGRVQSGVEAFVGQLAEAITELSPKGQVLFQGDVWNASTTVSVKPGAPVRIVSVHGLELDVEPVTTEVPKMSGAATGT